MQWLTDIKNSNTVIASGTVVVVVVSQIWEHESGGMTIYGERTVAAFSKKRNQARKPLARFLAVVRAAEWRHFPEVKQSFPATDYAAETGTLIFNIGGNK